MNACNIFPELIPNKDGVLEDPILFNDLMKLSGNNRDLSMTVYRMIDDSFIEKYGGKLKYDLLGNPTIASLTKIPAVKYIMDMNVDDALKNLNKLYDTGIYEYDEAVRRATAFNRNPNFNDKYFGTITEVTSGEDRGKMMFSIVKKSSSEVRALENVIRQRHFRDKLIYVLGNIGANVEFVDKLLDLEAGVKGVYSTMAPEKVFDSLYTVIKVLKASEEEKLTPEEQELILKEETGHLVIGIAENSPKAKLLYKRLMNLLYKSSPKDIRNVLLASGKYNEEQAEKMVDDTMFDIEGADNAIREAAGRIIASQLDQVRTSLKPLKHKGVGRKALIGLGVAGVGVGTLAVGGIAGAGIALTSGALAIISLSQRIRDVLKAMWNVADARWHGNKSTRLEDEILKEVIITEAKKLAQAFMDQDLGDILDALKTREELHHQSLLEARVANRLASSFNAFIRQMLNSGISPKEGRTFTKSISDALEAKKLFSDLAKKATKLTGDENAAEGFLSRGYYNMVGSMLGSINDLVVAMTDEATGKLHNLKSENFVGKLNNGEIVYIDDLNQRIQMMSLLYALIRLCSETESIMSSMYATNSEVSAEFMQQYHIDELRESIRTMIGPAALEVDNINKLLLQASFATINGGSKYIQTSMRLVRRNNKTIITDEVAPGFGRNSVTIVELLEGNNGLIEDCSAWGVFLLKMGSSSDPINQFASNLYDFNRAEANKAMYRYSLILLDFHERIKRVTGNEDTTFICEHNKDGTITGNIVLPDFNYGKWEDDYEEFCADEKKKLKEQYKKELADMNIYKQREFLFKKMSPKIKKWHSEHSLKKPADYVNELFSDETFEEEGPRLEYLPGKEYASDEWAKLTPEQKEFVKEYIKIKLSLDAFITEYHPNSVTSHRLPQFRGTTISRMKHKSSYAAPSGERNLFQKWHDKGMLHNSVYRTLHDRFIENFFEDALDEEFGDNSCYNREDDTFFTGAALTDREFMRRVPVYGINKLKDRYNVSTDVVMSTMQYAAMALNVRGLATTAAVLSNGEEVLKKRSINGSMQATKRGELSNVFRRFNKFLEMQVFNIRSNKLAIFETKSGRTLLANKIMSWMSKEGSWWLLAGKVASGFVNGGTGILLICCESAVGENFTREELVDGLIDYYKFAAKANFEEGLAPLNRSNKYYSFIRYYDSLNNNDSYFRDFTSHIQMGKWSLLRKVQYAMWVYETWNHLMQTLPYRLRGKHIKLYSLKEGVEQDAKGNYLRNGENFVEDGNIWDNFQEAQLQRGEKVAEMAAEMKKKTGKEYVSALPTLLHVDPNEEQRGQESMWGNPYLGNYYVKNADGTFAKYDRTEQSRFQTQCRYMTDNMHGIYNNPDSVALSQSVLGASILTMKKYLLGYVDKLFLTDRYSVADKRNTEGAVVTWLKMQDYYWRHGDSKIRTKLFMMGVPILLSAATSFGSSLILSAAAALSYNFLFSRFLLGGISGVKGILEQMRRDRIYEHQINNIKRFDTYMRLALMLRTLSMLLSNSLWGHSQDDDDDDDEEVKLEWGEKTDAEILKLFGYDKYEEALIEELTKSNGKLKDSPKTPGVLYTIVDDAINSESDDLKKERLLALQYGMGLSYYLLHRWYLEAETLYPFDLNRNTIDEAKILIGQNANIMPIGPSFMWGLGDKMLSCFDADKPVNYKYDKEAETFADIYEKYGDWDEDKIPDIIYAIRTGLHLIAGDNKGFNSLLTIIPYANQIGLFEDLYKGSTSYDFGRKMTVH